MSSPHQTDETDETDETVVNNHGDGSVVNREGPHPRQ
jgi:hypothetical protein